MSRKELLDKVKKLYKLFSDGKIPTLDEHEVHPDLPDASRARYLYFTLPPCLNFQRSSPAMWKAALATWEDPETQYLFFPEKLKAEKYEKVQKDLTKHKLALQKNRHTDIWLKISDTLRSCYNSDPRELLVVHNHDVRAIIQTLQVEKKKLFPYLGGPKMSNYWLYILWQYTDVEFQHMDALSIIPDTHVLQATVELGLAKEKQTPQETERLWHELLSGEDITPVMMHPVLWNWSRNNFKPEV